jgi:hypothetical protein
VFKAVAIAGATAFLAAGSGGAATSEQSTNWSGYAVTGPAFTVVRGRWIEPAANCLGRVTAETDSSFWVGLGGYAESSKGIEQIGTEADCSPDGRERYFAWYEMWPARSRDINLRVSAGDRMSAFVEVDGTTVIIQLRNLTTGRSFSRALRLAAPDTTSAEWIAEAPALVVSHGSPILPLTNFGRVTFSNAAATSRDGHAGTISGSSWTTRLMSLASGASRNPNPLQRFAEQASAVRAVPGPLQRGGSGFSVEWKHGSAATPPRTAPPGAA